MVAIKNESKFNVPISGPDGKVHHTLPGDVFPEWAENKITNPLVIGDQLMDDETRDARYREELAKLQAEYGVGEAKSEEGEPAKAGDPPPRKGPGSGADVWADYALDNDVEVEEGWSRDQIIAELEKAGKPV